MRRPFRTLILALLLAWLLNVPPAAAQELAPGLYTLKADDGHYLARCNGCVTGAPYPDSAGVHGDSGTAGWERWTLEKLANGKWALKADTGKYLTRCNGCAPGAKYPDSATAHAANPAEPYAQWTLSQQPSGKWVLQSDTGKYLARCYDCIPGAAKPNMAFVHESNPDAAYAQWTLAAIAAAAPSAPVTPAPAIAKLPETGPNPNLSALIAALNNLASATREKIPVSTIPSSGDFTISDPGAHINGMAQHGDLWFTNYPTTGGTSRDMGTIVAWDRLKAEYKAKQITTSGNFPAGMAVLERDKILAVAYSTSTIRFLDFSGGIGGIRELTAWDEGQGENLVRVGAAYNSDQGTYYLLLNTRLYRGRHGSWTSVGTVDWTYKASGEESISLLYLGYNTFAAIVAGSNDAKTAFQYTIFTVDGYGAPTVTHKDVSVTLANPPSETSFRWASMTQFNGNTFRLCGSMRRLDGLAAFECWNSPVNPVSYSVKITTASESGAGTDSNIYLTLTGPKGTTMEKRLNPLISGNAFESGNTDSVTFSAGDVGTPSQLTLRSDGTFAAANWRPQSVEVSSTHGVKLATATAWLDRGSVTLPLLIKKTYTVKIKTGSAIGAGTDANIFLTIAGVETRLNGLLSGNAFEKDDLNTLSFSQAVTTTSTPTSIRVRSDGLYAGADWYLEYIDIDGSRFTCNCWLNGATSKTLSR